MILRTMYSLRTYRCLLLALVCQCPMYTESIEAEIFWAPSLNITVPLERAQAVFQCGGQGSFLLWWIGDDLVVSHEEPMYEMMGFIFTKIPQSNGTIVSTLTISATVENNNTQLRCHATGDGGAVTSETVTLTVAGPPLTPQPIFHVVNATHIEVQWDKPFTIPGIDVRNYTLSIWNTSSTSYVFSNETFPVFEDTEYPIRYYVSNEGNIPNVCVYLNFTLSASNDAGTSRAGHTTGGFAIAPSPIDTQTLHHEVTFSTDITPMLLINFTFPTVCDYHDAHYAVSILDSDRRRIQQTETFKLVYDKDDPQSVEVEVKAGMERDKIYTAVINVTTAVKSTTTEFTFHTYLGQVIPTGEGLNTKKVGSLHKDTIIIISSALAGGLFIILFAVTMFLLTGFILRRRKLKRRTRANRHEIDTDEAVQRAALAMIPNPIYSGNPIYDEIADPKLLKFLQSEKSESQSRDECYVEISSQATNMCATPQPGLESKLVRDKCTTYPEDTYTVMNPAGTLSNQIRSPIEKGPPALAMMYNSGGNDISSSEHQLGSATQSNGYLTGLGNSASSSTFTSTHNQDELEERYVKGAF